MKQVVALVHDDKVALKWREGWDATDWLPDAGDITKGWEYYNPIDEDLELRLRVMDYGFSQNPVLRDSVRDPKGNPDSPRMLPLTNTKFISVLVNNVRELLTEWDWILTEVARYTGDDSLHQFTSIGHALDAKWRTEDVQKAKEDEEREKAKATRALRYPSLEHKYAGYMKALKQFGGKWEPGDHDAKEAFLKTFVDESYYERCDAEDPIYDKIVAVEWNITPKTAENEITKLRKAKLIK